MVRALDLEFEGPEFSSCSERCDVHDSPEFKFSGTLVNSQLVCLLPVVLFCFVLFYHVVCDSTTVCWGTSSSVGYTEDSETQSTNCLFQVVVLYFLLVLALRFYGHTAEFRVLGANLTATQI